MPPRPAPGPALHPTPPPPRSTPTAAATPADESDGWPASATKRIGPPTIPPNERSAARRFFDEHGYYHAKAVYSPTQIAALKTEFDRVVAQLLSGGAGATGSNSSPDNGLISTFNVQKYSSLWLTHGLLHAPFLDLAEEFLGPNIVLQRTSLYEKRRPTPGFDGPGPFRSHQDWSYGPVRDDSIVCGTIHVAPASADNGALLIWPGTHKRRMEQSTAGDRDAAFHQRYSPSPALADRHPLSSRR